LVADWANFGLTSTVKLKVFEAILHKLSSGKSPAGGLQDKTIISLNRDL
jgi:hypothetical protein